MPNWLNLTQHSGVASADNAGSTRDTTVLPRLVFKPEGLNQMADGKRQKVKLQFNGSVPSSGTSINVSVSSVEVEMTVLSVVSLHASSLKVLVSDPDNEQTEEHLWKPGGAAIEVQQGQSVAVAVTAVDDDGFAVTAGTRSLTMRIGAGNGRTVDLKRRNGAFQAQIFDLRSSVQPGLYQLWFDRLEMADGIAYSPSSALRQWHVLWIGDEWIYGMHPLRIFCSSLPTNVTGCTNLAIRVEGVVRF